MFTCFFCFVIYFLCIFFTIFKNDKVSQALYLLCQPDSTGPTQNCLSYPVAPILVFLPDSPALVPSLPAGHPSLPARLLRALAVPVDVQPPSPSQFE